MRPNWPDRGAYEQEGIKRVSLGLYILVLHSKGSSPRASDVLVFRPFPQCLMSLTPFLLLFCNIIDTKINFKLIVSPLPGNPYGFKKPVYEVKESADHVTITIQRGGSLVEEGSVGK